jgi:hypothetical protein
MARRGWLRTWGGAADSTVVTLATIAPLEAASEATGQIVAAEAAWLSAHAIDNALPGGEWIAMFSPGILRAQRTQLLEQRERAGRIQLALLVYGAALEPPFPPEAAAMRRAARSFGVIASFLGDRLACGFETGADAARLRWRMGMLAAAAQAMGRQPPPDAEFERAPRKPSKFTLHRRARPSSSGRPRTADIRCPRSSNRLRASAAHRWRCRVPATRRRPAILA